MMSVFQNSQNNLASVGQFRPLRTYYNDREEFQSPKLESVVKQPRQTHTCQLIINIILIVVLIVGVTLIALKKMQAWILGVMLVMPFMGYIIPSMILEPLKTYMKNMKNVASLNPIFEELKSQTWFLKISVECFHYGGRHRTRFVSHIAVETIPVQVCVDQTENLEELMGKNQYLFCTMSRCFYFSDADSQAKFEEIMKRFKAANVRDSQQTWFHSLDISLPTFEREIGICASGTGGFLRPLFFIFTILGLSYPYLIIVECLAARYHINFIKRITL